MPAGSEQHAFDQLLGIHGAMRTQRYKGVSGTRLARGNIGNVGSENIKTPDLDRPIKLTEPLGEQRLGPVAGLSRVCYKIGCGGRTGNVGVDHGW